MQKEELLHLHMLMVQLRKYYETVAGEEITTDDYDSLAVSPVHIHRNKKCHKDAILALGTDIVAHMRGSAIPMMNFSSKTVAPSVAVEP